MAAKIGATLGKSGPPSASAKGTHTPKTCSARTNSQTMHATIPRKLDIPKSMVHNSTLPQEQTPTPSNLSPIPNHKRAEKRRIKQAIQLPVTCCLSTFSNILAGWYGRCTAFNRHGACANISIRVRQWSASGRQARAQRGKRKAQNYTSMPV